MTLAAARGGARVGIDAMHAYVGRAYVDVRELFEARGLNLKRFDNLRMHQKSVALPGEDAVTNAVNAARPLLARLTEAERDRIELLIVATESAVDKGKSTATWVHAGLGLGRRCRAFDVTQACYGATTALQMAAAIVASHPDPGVRALVISSDHALSMAKGTYAEPSQGSMAIAMLVSTDPRILEIDIGASGLCAYDVADACRPAPGVEEADPQLTLFSYLDGLTGSFRDYRERVGDVDVTTAFSWLLFHTPFAGMVVGAHRKLLATFSDLDKAAIAADFGRRVEPSLAWCVRSGNGYSASLYLALCGLVDHAPIPAPGRVGMYSYGSGCSSEFFSGILRPSAREQVAAIGIGPQLDARARLSVAEYDALLDARAGWDYGVRDRVLDTAAWADLWASHVEGAGLYLLERVDGYKRSYRWT